MATRDIEAHLRQLYGVSVGRDRRKIACSWISSLFLLRFDNPELKAHLLPALAAQPLESITPEQIDAWRRGLTGPADAAAEWR